jgi:membrane protein YdbS with pleckstrin-like domain
MYESLRDVLLELFQAPKEPPEPPAGRHESVQVFRASPSYLSYQYLFFLLGMLVLGFVFLIAIVIVLEQQLSIGIIAGVALLLLWLLILIGGYFIIRLEYDMRYYIITDRSLRVRKGVLTILEQTMTFMNIQNLQIQQGPVERAYGISSLVVETAGGGGAAASPEGASLGPNYHRAILSGLEDADTIRDLILNYLKRLPHSSGLGHPEDREHGGQNLASHGFSPAEVQALREILHELKAFRAAANSE